MRLTHGQTMEWRVEAVDPPVLTNEQWGAASLLGVLFLVMAILQLISFSDFKGILSGMGMHSGTAFWAIVIIIAELWAAAGLFKWRLSHAFRMVSAGLAVLVSGFWFLMNLQQVANGNGDALHNSGFFGRFLAQTPGWWTVLEVTILLFWTLWAIELFKAVLMMPARR